MQNPAFIQYVKYQLDLSYSSIIREADDYLGQHDCLQRLIDSKYEDLPLVLPDIPQEPLSYKELCSSFIDLRRKYPRLYGPILLDLPEAHEILSQFVETQVDTDADWKFVERAGEQLIHLAEVCVTLGEYGYAKKCLQRVILVEGTWNYPKTVSQIKTRLIATGIKLLPLPKGTKV